MGKVVSGILPTGMKEAIDFVSEISHVPYKVDLSYENNTLNAKSILGVLGMAAGRKVILTIYNNEVQVKNILLPDELKKEQY